VKQIENPHIANDERAAWGLQDELLRRFRIAVLAACKGNRTKAANFCGVPRRSFRFQLARYRAMGYDIPAPQRGKDQTTTLELEKISFAVFNFPIEP
jgi:DNA-binding NtrC family response regulator